MRRVQVDLSSAGHGDRVRRDRASASASDRDDRPVDPAVEVRRLRDRIADLEQVVAVLGAAEARTDDDREDRGAVQRHARWGCRACGALLAFYDASIDVLRIRYKDHVAYVRAGPGGFVQIVCRSCGEPNTSEYVPGDDEPGDAAALGRPMQAGG